MKAKTWMVLITCVGLFALLLACTLTPALTPSPISLSTTTASGTTATPDTKAAITLPVATTVNPNPPTPTLLPQAYQIQTAAAATPTPTLTAEELLARELIQQGGQVAYSADGCGRILKGEPWCSVINLCHLEPSRGQDV